MKLKREVLILGIVLVSVGFAKAEKPTSYNPQSVQVKPAVEVEPTSVLTMVDDKKEGQNLESTPDDSFLFDSDNLNLSFQYSNQPDSVDFSVIQYYIKNVMPIVKNVDSKSYDLVEIL